MRSNPARSWAWAKARVYSRSMTGPLGGWISEARRVAIIPMNSTLMARPSAAGRGGRRVGSWKVAAHRVELGIRPHVGQVGHAVGQVEEGGHRADVPDVGVAETVLAQPRQIRGVDGPGVARDLGR